ncbi:hydroxyacyl-ACP dehydratase HTD2-like protein with hotdog domain [Spinactinospora alkalitolerans]|uniref:Hydroxyacyl-ACP dehydratase HTD2-like protein with hotdog domain n=1 Tax=Spinactinospora alkalitolerans TaxID=687207 RepID=A0A852TN88_9ACTN|nr:MaoC family dehydratase N-terminal domain-containing protein [Spinactinospora alkalitolerans]NYE45429.1 hydroxyacyl-ACP dehydratase HTD2-like protein with hotdog domain [Spinactinospora alkalitolerans]
MTTTGIEALHAAVGWRGAVRTTKVERRHLYSYLDAIGAPRSDEAPLTFVACYLDEPPSLPAAAHYGTGWLNGEDSFEGARPLRVGQTLHSSPLLTEVDEKHGRSGRFALLTFVTDFTDDSGEVVVRHTGVRLRR